MTVASASGRTRAPTLTAVVGSVGMAGAVLGIARLSCSDADSPDPPGGAMPITVFFEIAFRAASFAAAAREAAAAAAGAVGVAGGTAAALDGAAGTFTEAGT